MTSTGDEADICDCKIGTVVGKRGLQDVHDGLVSRWEGENESSSLRDLAQFFNEQVIESALGDTGYSPLDGEVENYYRLLTGDASRGMETQARSQLAEKGVDVDELESDFVSYQTVNRHFENCLERDRAQPDESGGRDRASDRLFALRSRTEAVTEQTIRELRNREDFALGEFDVLVDVSVRCSDCGHISSLDRLLDAGGCPQCRQ